MTATTLSAYLLALPSTERSMRLATKHHFLERAGRGTLDESQLNGWLKQDLHYAKAYVRLMGGLLCQIQFPTESMSKMRPGVQHPHHRAFDLLVSALTNIKREIEFFGDTADKYRLDQTQNTPPNAVTRAYMDLFGSIAAGGRGGGVLEGLVVLWATELCYFEAWSYAKKCGDEESTHPLNSSACNMATKALHETLIPNWTSNEFLQFVTKCEDVLNAVAEREGLGHDFLSAIRENIDQPVKVTTDDRLNTLLRLCKETFEQVLWLEERFWPNAEG